MTKKPNAGNCERQRRPIASIALRTGGLMGVVILGGLFVASCGSSMNEVDTTVAAPTRAQTKTVAEEHFIFERFGKAVQGVADWGKDETNETNLARQASLRETIRLERERAKSEVHPKDLPKTSPVPKLALMAPKPLNAMAQDAMPDAPMPVDLYRFALNALLVPLLDDSIPPRWTDAAIDFSCEPGTSITVDGEPLVAGKLIPAKAFTVRWNMDRCAPMGPESVELSGSVELLVFHEDAGLSAVVMPDRLRVDSHMGRTWLRGPFAAETSLATSATDREVTPPFTRPFPRGSPYPKIGVSQSPNRGPSPIVRLARGRYSGPQVMTTARTSRRDAVMTQARPPGSIQKGKIS